MFKLFSPPRFDDQELTRRVALMYKINVSTALILTGTLTVSMCILPENAARYFTIIAMMWSVSILLSYFFWKGRVNFGAHLYVILLLLMIYGLGLNAGGIKAHGMVMLPIIVLIAGLTLGKRMVIIYGFISCGVSLLIALAEYNGFIMSRGPLGNSPFIYWIHSTAAMLILVLLEHTSVTGLEKQIIKTQEELELRKKSEGEVKLLNESLEDKIRERTAELIAANNELNTFNYSISHDLQQPLVGVKMLLGSLQKRQEATLDENSKRELQIVVESVDKMNTLTKELLKLYSLSKVKLNKSDTDMNDLIKEVCEDVRAYYKMNTIEMTVHDTHHSFCDPTLIRQVWANLISNAVKYSSKNEKPVIEISSRQTDKEVIYEVKDNGVGFNMKHAEKIFSDFERLHTSDEYEGTGIGLTTASRIIKYHGGRIWAEAAEGSGATFYFSIPAVKELSL
ncbi:MAG: sensor histidine kinase [Bacteroidia bacterium]